VKIIKKPCPRSKMFYIKVLEITFIRRFVKCDRVFLSTGIRARILILNFVLDTISTVSLLFSQNAIHVFMITGLPIWFVLQPSDRSISVNVNYIKWNSNKQNITVNMPRILYSRENFRVHVFVIALKNIFCIIFLSNNFLTMHPPRNNILYILYTIYLFV